MYNVMPHVVSKKKRVALIDRPTRYRRHVTMQRDFSTHHATVGVNGLKYN